MPKTCTPIPTLAITEYAMNVVFLKPLMHGFPNTPIERLPILDIFRRITPFGYYLQEPAFDIIQY